MLFLELLQNAALLLAVCFAQRFISAYGNKHPFQGRIASGVLFGGAAVLAMAMAVQFAPGIIFDSRTVVLSMGALFGGPVVAAVSGAMAAAYRVHLGGAGTLVGLGVIAASLALGLACRRFCAPAPARIGIPQLFFLGLAVHLTSVALFHLLPVIPLHDRLAPIFLPYVVVLTLASVAMGLLLREIESARVFDAILDDSRERYRTLFNSATVAIFEVNLTTVFRQVRQLREAGVSDLRVFLADNPDLVSDLINSVRVVRVNPAALRLFGVSSERAFRREIERFFNPETRKAFIDSLCAVWGGAETFTVKTVYLAQDGRPIACIHAMPVPHTEAAARRVPVTIVDISAQQESERQLAEERRRLEEILWGTNVGTWEWNVQTGELTLNERWAGIAGYTLDELAPVSIQTWIDLAHPDDLAESNRQVQQAFGRTIDYYDCEIRLRHKAGHWVWIQDRGKVVEWADDGQPLRMSGTHTDVTERKVAEEHAQRLSIVRDTLLRCHAAILREQDETRLFQRVAEVLVEARGYALVWLGLPLPGDEKRVKLIARAGDAAGYVDLLDIRWKDGGDPAFRPTATAVRTGKVQVAHDLREVMDGKPWAEEAQRRGFKSYLVAPIRCDGETAAILYVYSSIEEAFDDVEIDLITEFSNNIGLALRSIRLSRETTSLHSALEDAAFGAVRAIAATIEKRDPYTSGHQENVAAISVAIAHKLGWPPGRIDGLRLGATIHDIGKIYIPSEILNRPGRLTDSEFGMVKSHPQVGYEILENTSFPWPIKEMVVQHHERIDGTGYPQGLKGDEIIEEAKIIAVADVVDAITSHRPYRPGKGVDVALEEIERGRGTAYDPAVADTCLRMIRDEGFRWGDFRN